MIRIKHFFLLYGIIFLTFTFYCSANAALLTFSFDDGHKSIWNAYEIMSKNNLVGTANSISSSVGTSSRLSWQQLHTIENGGWEIVSHSMSHPSFNKIPQTYGDELLSGWSKTSGYNNLYSTNYSYEELPRMFQNNNVMYRKSNLSDVENNPGTYYLDGTSGVAYVHTIDNSNPLNSEMRADSVQRELQMSKETFVDHGLNVQNFVVPKSQWNTERAEMASAYYNSVGVAYNEANGGYYNNIPLVDKYWLSRKIVRKDTTLSEVEDWITEAIANDSWFILMFHILTDTPESSIEWSIDDFESLTNWVAAQDINVVTQQQGLEFAEVPLPQSLLLLFSGISLILCYKKS